PCLARCGIQRSADLAGDHARADLVRQLDDALLDRAVGQAHLDPMVAVALVAEAAQLTGRVDLEPQLRTRAQPGQYLLRAWLLEDAVHRGGRHAHLLEQFAEGLPLANLDRLP